MTKISPDERCQCGGVLVPPNMTTMTAPTGVDYVCLKCGRAYEWRGTPPQLVIVVPSRQTE